MSARPKRIVAFGEVLWDVLSGGRELGGAPLNFAYRAHELGESVGMVSRVGNDVLGQEALARMHSLGLGTEFVQSDAEHPTGTVQVTFDADGNPRYTITPGVAYDYIGADVSAVQAGEAADCIYFGTLAQREPTARASCRRLLAAARAAVRLLDLNLRRNCFTGAVVTESLARADVVKLNEEEAHQLPSLLGWSRGGRQTAAVARRLVQEYGLQCCVVTLAERGALAVSAAGESICVPGYRTAQTDPLGAGDAFAAAFMSRYLRGAGLRECCAYGNAMGALVVRQSGATAPVGAEEVAALAASAAA